MLKFEIYAGSTTLDDLGTLATVVGKRGTLAFIPKNLKSIKRVCIVLKNAEGESTTLSCSSAVSDSVRNALAKGVEKQRVLATLAKLSVLEGETGIPYLCAPAGEGAGLEEFTVEQLATEKTANYEELVAF